MIKAISYVDNALLNEGTTDKFCTHLNISIWGSNEYVLATLSCNMSLNHMFILNMAITVNNWIKQKIIPQLAA